MFKIFLSHPMSGYTDEQILKYRTDKLNWLKSNCRKLFPDSVQPEDLVLVDSFRPGADDVHYLKLLGEAISKMSEADVVVFVPEYAKSKGCRVERTVVETCGLPSIFL